MTYITQNPSLKPFSPPAVHDPEAAVKAEFSRLIHAAIINQKFRQKLLSNPLSSIEDGYCGESFHFPPEFKECIQLIHAESLESLSMQVMQTLTSARVPERAALRCQ